MLQRHWPTVTFIHTNTTVLNLNNILYDDDDHIHTHTFTIYHFPISVIGAKFTSSLTLDRRWAKFASARDVLA